MGIRIRAWAATDVGILRDHNEDCHLTNDELGLCVVADGMGGHAAGELASSIAVRTVEETVASGLTRLAIRRGGSTIPFPVGDVPATPADGDAGPKGGTMVMGAMPVVADHTEAQAVGRPRLPVEEVLVDAIRAASGAILDEVERNPEKTGMGTTVSAILCHEDRVYYAHVGDSRIYHVHHERIVQVSEDHSLVQEQIKAGLLSEEEGKRSRFRNIITRSVGFDRLIEVDTGVVDVKPGDLLLLCSDGLSNLVRDPEILEIATRQKPEMCLKFCINLANSRGGDDNITAVIAEVLDA